MTNWRSQEFATNGQEETVCFHVTIDPFEQLEKINQQQQQVLRQSSSFVSIVSHAFVKVAIE